MAFSFEKGTAMEHDSMAFIDTLERALGSEMGPTYGFSEPFSEKNRVAEISFLTREGPFYIAREEILDSLVLEA